MARWSKGEKPWERQPGESAQAYEAFDAYPKMGVERSCRKVAQALSKSDTIIRRWSSAWKWQERCRAYDNELKRQELIQAQKAVKQMQERQIQTAMLLQKKAVQALNELDISELTPQEILRFISEGAKLETANRASSTQQVVAAAADDTKAPTLANTIISAFQRREDDDDE